MTASLYATGAHLRALGYRNLTEASMTARRHALDRLARALAPTTLLTASAADLGRWRAGLRGAPVTVSNEISHARGFYRWAQAEGLRADDPTVRLIRPRVPRYLPRPIGEADLATALAGAPGRVRPWLVLAGYAGLRAREIALLERHDVCDRADPSVLVITHGKGGRARVVPLGAHVLTELHRAGLPSRGIVFGRADGAPGPNSPHRVSALCNDYLHGLGLTDTLHSLRHRFASAVYATSCDLRLTQELLGHCDPATTSGYVAYSSLRAVDTIAALDAALAS